MSRALEILDEVFGYSAFRGQQGEIVEHVAGGGDCLVLMPTGGGKSLTMQMALTMTTGIAIIIVPLLALTADQVEKINRASQKYGSVEASH